MLNSSLTTLVPHSSRVLCKGVGFTPPSPNFVVNLEQVCRLLLTRLNVCLQTPMVAMTITQSQNTVVCTDTIHLTQVHQRTTPFLPCQATHGHSNKSGIWRSLQTTLSDPEASFRTSPVKPALCLRHRKSRVGLSMTEMLPTCTDKWKA